MCSTARGNADVRKWSVKVLSDVLNESNLEESDEEGRVSETTLPDLVIKKLSHIASADGESGCDLLLLCRC